MDEIKTSSGRVVGSWDGKCVKQLMAELQRIKTDMAKDKASDALISKEMPHREQLHEDLKSFKAYHLWGCDVNGQCLVGSGANRIESVEKVLSFSLIDHH
jgi:Tfp pilus assembly ATPase PilU